MLSPSLKENVYRETKERMDKYSPEFLTPHNMIEESRRVRQIFPPMSRWHYGWKYVDELARFRQGGISAPSPQKISSLRQEIILETVRRYGNNLCPQYPFQIPETMQATLDKMTTLVADNPAVFDFFSWTDQEVNFGDCRYRIEKPSVFASEFFIPWRINSVPRAECLEFAYGFAPDWFGRFRKIPETDLSYYLAFMDPLFGGIVDRGAKVVEWLNEEKPKKIIFAPAGLAPEFRHLGLTLEKDQSAILIDRDPTIEYDQILAQLPFKDQITVLQGDLLEQLQDPRCANADTLVCTGFLTYCWEKLPAIIGLFRKVLHPDGTLILDVNADHWVLPRNEAVSFYLPMKTFSHGFEAEISLQRALAMNKLPTEDIERFTCYDVDDKPTEFVFRAHT